MDSKKENPILVSVSISFAGTLPNISKELKNFITQDEMEGFESLQLMLDDENLSKKVPNNIRKEYEAILAELTSHRENAISNVIKKLEKQRSNAKTDAIKLLQEATQTFF